MRLIHLLLVALLCAPAFAQNNVKGPLEKPGGRDLGTMTEVQRDSLSGVVTGDHVINTDAGSWERWDGATWQSMGGGGIVPEDLHYASVFNHSGNGPYQPGAISLVTTGPVGTQNPMLFTGYAATSRLPLSGANATVNLSGITANGSDQFVVANTGRYVAAADVTAELPALGHAAGISILVDDLPVSFGAQEGAVDANRNKQVSHSTHLDLVAGQVVSFNAWQTFTSSSLVSAYNITLAQLPSSTVISPADAVVQEWTTFPMVIGGSITAPTKGTTTVDLARYKVIGKTLIVRYELEQSGPGTAGNGNYLFPLPAGFTVDLPAPAGNLAFAQVLGGSAMGYDGTTIAYGVPRWNSTDNAIELVLGNPSDFIGVGNTWYSLDAATSSFSFEAHIPIQ